MQSALPLGSYNSAGPTVMEVAKNAVRGLWRTPVGESQGWRLKLCRKFMLSTEENYISLEKQFLTSYRGQVTLVEAECLTMKRQMTHPVGTSHYKLCSIKKLDGPSASFS